MNRVIKDYSKLTSALQEEIYEGFSEGVLERTTFPFKGKITDGVICTIDEITYLIPIDTIVAVKVGSSDIFDDDDDDDDDVDPSEMDTEVEDTDEE